MSIKINNKILPEVGLGCMGMSEFYGDTDDAASLQTLKRSYEIGYRHYDTADMYGQGRNELLLGQFIKTLGEARDNIHIASKVGIQRDSNDKYNLILNGSREYIHKSCNDSLKRLGTDYLDLYYLHRKDPNILLEESLTAIKELIDSGKVKAAGLCEVSSETLSEANKILKISAIQSEYSLWSRDIEDEIIPLCKDLDITIVAFSPMGRGFLTGKISKKHMDTAVSDKDFRASLPRFNGENYDKNIKLVNKIIDISSSLNIKASQLSLAWILSKSDNIIVIPGTKQEKYLLENFESLNIKLDNEVIREIESIFTKDSISGDRYPERILKKSNK